MIVVFWHPADDEVTYIEVDHAAGARLAVTNLLERGFTRIGFLGGSETSPANKIRLMAYQKILQENGLRADRDWISFGGFRLESGYERIRKMLNSDNPPDAVFCGNDYIALGVLQYLREQKISVPDDFGLIGYDDIYFASLPMIQMSSVQQPRKQLGEVAVEALHHEIESFPEHTKQRILIEPTLKIRST